MGGALDTWKGVVKAVPNAPLLYVTQALAFEPHRPRFKS